MTKCWDFRTQKLLNHRATTTDETQRFFRVAERRACPHHGHSMLSVFCCQPEQCRSVPSPSSSLDYYFNLISISLKHFTRSGNGFEQKAAESFFCRRSRFLTCSVDPDSGFGFGPYAAHATSAKKGSCERGFSRIAQDCLIEIF